MDVAVIDSGGANVGSVLQALARLSVDAQLTQDAEAIQQAPRVILPGVGTAHAAMDTLQSAGLVSTIQQLTQPVLGICLGLQLLFDASTEGEKTTPCLGIIGGVVEKLPNEGTLRLPHMGWSQIEWVKEDPVATHLMAGDWFYFVHSYAVLAPCPAIVATSDHGQPFAAVVRHHNFVACQFHPEKSADAGQRLLQGFLAS